MLFIQQLEASKTQKLNSLQEVAGKDELGRQPGTLSKASSAHHQTICLEGQNHAHQYSVCQEINQRKNVGTIQGGLEVDSGIKLLGGMNRSPQLSLDK